MKVRKCPRCHKEMKEDCYLKDEAQPISDYTIIEKDEDYKKKNHPLKVAICNTCGYVEFYVDVNED